MDDGAMRGLSSAEAEAALAQFGPNVLPRVKERRLMTIARETLREPMFLLLLGAAALYLALGDFGEGLFLVGGACISIALVIFQEARSERALAALRELAQPQARVLRDGIEVRVPAQALVVGDVVMFGEGDRLAADALFIAGDAIGVDESALTGESAPVTKRPATPEERFDPAPAPGAALSPYLYAGTLTVRGHGAARVARTGVRTALGQIGRSLALLDETPTPLQQSAGKIVGALSGVALIICALVALAYGALRSDWVGGALAGVTFAIALIPEEFPMVLAVFLALGAWRLATHRVLVRRSATIEALGAASVLCVDKTGTLTQQEMDAAQLWTPSEGAEAIASSDGARELLSCALAACAAHGFDPMDRAIQKRARALGLRPPHGEPEQTWPFTPARLAMAQLWRDPAGMRVIAAKGAPEAILRLCRLEGAQSERAHAVLARLADDGLRVLGVARARAMDGAAEPLEEQNFEFLGLIGFVDPLREDAKAALAEAREAGVSVIMITGDHPATARAIARNAGMDTQGGVLTGAELTALDDAALQEALGRVRIFARIAPEQKLRIVTALQARGAIVAMTGDGVNDAPALQAAHIGIAMGRRGTDVAREAADLVLLDDSFSSLVGGVRLGRRIFANLRKALTYIVAIHAPIAGLALLPILFGLPPLLFPAHVMMMELAIDPLCALAFEGERSDDQAMKRPPRRADEPLFGRREIFLALLQGCAALLGVFGLYFFALQSLPEAEARATAFIALVLTNLVLALLDAAGREGRLFDAHRRIYWTIAFLLCLLMALMLTFAPVGALFRIAAPPPSALALALATALACGGAAWAAGRVLQRGR